MAVTEHRHGFFSQDFYLVHFVTITNVTNFKIITTYAIQLQHYICTTALHGCIICNICAYDHANEHSYMIVLYLSFRIKSIEVVSADLCFWDVTLTNLSTPVYIRVHRLFRWYEACGITWKMFFLFRRPRSSQSVNSHSKWRLDGGLLIPTPLQNYERSLTFEHIIIHFLHLLKMDFIVTISHCTELTWKWSKSNFNFPVMA